MELGSEGSKPQLDWVDGIEKALARPDLLAAVEEEAAGYLRRGYHHLVWSGMGGSMMAVHVLKKLGFVGGIEATVRPLDFTDPAAFNRLLRELTALEASGQQPDLAADAPLDRDALRAALDRTLLVAVAMGMTSEEPITHAAWFWGLLGELGVESPEEHLQVIALEGSFLERYALERGIRTFPLALEGECLTAGRMSAPSTRVFLRPAAWGLAASALARDPGATFDGALLGAALRRAQALYGVSGKGSGPERVPPRGRTPSSGWGPSSRTRSPGPAATSCSSPFPPLGRLRPLAGAAGGGKPGQGRQGLPGVLRPGYPGPGRPPE